MEGGTSFSEGLRAHAGLTTTLGMFLVVIGVLALFAPAYSSAAFTLVIALLLVAAGIVKMVFAFRAKAAGGGPLTFIWGILAVLIGLYMLARPGVAVEALTLFLAAYFLVTGLFEIVFSLQVKPTDGWAFSLITGIVSILLAAIIWGQFPVSGLWAIGIVVGVKLIFSGWTLVGLGNAARSTTEAAEAA